MANNRYETPAKGTADWHLPLNSNFDKLDRDVEVRDAEANRGAYDPASGSKFLSTDTGAVYIGDGSQWNYLGEIVPERTGSGGSGSDLMQLLNKGYVVPAGPNLDSSDAIDPSTTSTPVQDAINRLKGMNDGGGTVYLPPGTTRNAGSLSGLQSIRLQGMGVSTNGDGERNSILEITGNNAGYTAQSWDDIKWAYMDGFTLSAGDRQSKPALHFNGSINSRMFNIGDLRFEGWSDANRGVICFESNHCFSSQWNNIHFERTHGPCINIGPSDKPNWLLIGNMYANGATKDPAILVDNQSPKMLIDYLNVGQSMSAAIDMNQMYPNGHIGCRYINYEPKGSQTGSTEFVVRANGLGRVELGSVVANGASGLNSVDQIVELGHNSGNNIIHSLYEQGVNVRTNRINVTSKPGGYTWYFGPSSDVTNNAGSNTGRVRTLANAGKGNA